MEKFDLSVILPLKSSSHPWFEDYFNKAITSIKTQEVEINELILVHTDETKLVEFLDTYDFSGINVTREVWTKKPGFAEQVNHGARIAKSKWGSESSERKSLAMKFSFMVANRFLFSFWNSIDSRTLAIKRARGSLSMSTARF